MIRDSPRFPPARTRPRAGTFRNGASRARTGDLLGAIQALSQLSYSPADARHAGGRRDRSVVAASVRAGGRDMVRRQMGLLDEAIREHLELKRRRGADPGEVAREQGEAFPRGRHERFATRGDGYAPSDEVTPEAVAAATSKRDERPAQDAPPSGQLALSGDRGRLDQETAEFDMATVLSDSPEAPDEDFPPARRIVVGPAPGSSPDELQDDALEWDFPGGGPRDPVDSESDEGRLIGPDNEEWPSIRTASPAGRISWPEVLR